MVMSKCLWISSESSKVSWKLGEIVRKSYLKFENSKFFAAISWSKLFSDWLSQSYDIARVIKCRVAYVPRKLTTRYVWPDFVVGQYCRFGYWSLNLSLKKGLTNTGNQTNLTNIRASENFPLHKDLQFPRHVRPTQTLVKLSKTLNMRLLLILCYYLY